MTLFFSVGLYSTNSFLMIDENTMLFKIDLIDAIKKNDVEMVRMSVDISFDFSYESIDTVDVDGKTLLHIATYFGAMKIIELLIKKGASLNILDYNEKSLLDYAKKGASKDVFKLLDDIMFLYCKATSYKKIDETSLKRIREILRGKQKEIILQAMFREERDEVTGFSLLHFAVYNCHMDLIKELIEAGADVNGINSLNETPLHYLFDSDISDADEFESSVDVESDEYLDMIRYLIGTFKFDLTITNHSVETILDVAKKKKYAKVVHLLKRFTEKLGLKGH